MKPFILLLLFFSIPTQSRAQTSLEREGLRGPIKAVEYFTTEFWESDGQMKQYPRRLSRIAQYNLKGDLVENWIITNDSGGSYYERRVYKYDSNRRRQAEFIYTSAKTGTDEYFSSFRSGSVLKLVPEMSERMRSRTDFEYDRAGNLAARITRDPNENENVIEQHFFEYDSQSRPIRFAIAGPDGIVTQESRTSYPEPTLIRSISTMANSTISPQTGLVRRDQKGRMIVSEGYLPKPDLVNPEDINQYTLGNRATYTYVGEISTMDWRIFGSSGERSRILITLRGDNQLSRREFRADPLPSGTRPDDSPEPDWKLTEEIIYEYEFDKLGNKVRESWRERCGPDKTFRPRYIFESAITYF